MKEIIAEHTKTRGRYKVLSSEAKMKHPDTREWVDAVIYESYEDLRDGEYFPVLEKKIYSREKKDFIEKFTLTLGL